MNVLNFSFIDVAIKYLDEWTTQFSFTRDFLWINLKEKPEWGDISNTMNLLANKNFFDLEEMAGKMFDQYNYVKNYVTDEKIEEWREKKMDIDKRWVEIFLHFRNHNVPFDEISTVVEYILCLPGTNATVERIFSTANKSWTREKSQLHISVLKSILFVKYNIELSCIEMFKLLQSRDDLLKKIASKEKYGDIV